MRIELAGTRGNAVRRANVDGTCADGDRFVGSIDRVDSAHIALLRRLSETLKAPAYAPGSTKGAA